MVARERVKPGISRSKRQVSRRITGSALGVIVLFMVGAVVYVLPHRMTSAEHREKKQAPTVAPLAVETVSMPEQLVARMQKLAVKSSATPKPVKQPLPRPSQEPRHTFRNRGGPAKNQSGDKKIASGGAKTAQQGTIPELVIDLAGHVPEAVAEHYGFVLAVQSYSENALLGVFQGKRLVPLAEDELRRFASRGRSTAGLANEFTFKRIAAEATAHPFDDIGLLYLVPRSVDRTWIRWQREIVKQAGYAFEEVTCIKAQYNPDFSLHAYGLVLKDGQTLILEERSP